MKLPPLNALRAFEAAARTGGYAAAAQELGVSPAAISQQVRNLEHFFRKRLFERLGNRVMLTEAGREIQEGATEGLGRIADMSGHVLSGFAPARLVVSTPPSLAGRWLAPRLPDFLAAHPGIDVDLRVKDDPLDFAAEGLDLRICYGKRLYPELDVMPLFEDRVVPMASPDFLLRHGLTPGDDLAELDGNLLILTYWGPSFATHPTWDDWFRQKGARRRHRSASGLTAAASSLALQLARAGLGVALGQLALAREDLEAGALVRLDPDALPIGHPYCAATQPNQRRRASLLALLEMLRHDPAEGDHLDSAN